MISQYTIPYIGIGIIIAIISDICIRQTKSSEPFTFLEMVTCIIIWPYIVFQTIKGFFNGQY